jgi:hypothetical protein
VAALIYIFSITELLLHKNGNIALRSTGGTMAAVCGYGNTDYDYMCDYLCHVTQCCVNGDKGLAAQC